MTPGLAVIEQLWQQASSPQIVYIDAGRETEQLMLREWELEQAEAAEAGLWERSSLSVPSLTELKRRPLKVARSWLQAHRAARRLMADYRPDLVVGLGAASSIPLVRAAGRSRIPVVLLEQNRVAGRATRFLSRRVQAVCLAMPLQGAPLVVRPGAEVIVTGNPTRSRPSADSFQPIPSPNIAAPTGQPLRLTVTGGSQGAAAINQLMLAAVHAHPDRFRSWHILHQTGPRDCAAVAQAYTQLGISHEVVGYCPHLPVWFQQSQLAITRAGATTLAELAIAGCPAIAVPYPYATQDHQRANAAYFAQHQAVVMVDQQPTVAAGSQDLQRVLLELLESAELRRRMSQAAQQLAQPQAAANVARIILRMLD